MAIHEYKRPEDPHEEARFTLHAFHQCAEFWEYSRQHGAEAAKVKTAVMFPVGLFGFEIPLGVPFDVWSTEPCELCGKTPTIHVMWKGARVFDLGAAPKDAA